MSVSQIIETYKNKIKDDNIFFAPNIPQQKLTNAIKSYAEGVNESDVLLLVDDTVFGGAKEGMMVTHTEILYKNLLVDGGSFKFSEIETIGENHGLVLSDIVINGVEIQLSQPRKKNKRLLGELLKEVYALAQDRKQDSKLDLDWSEVEQQISAPVPKNCSGCGAPNQLRSCEYCETPV
jgi:hypothetical protein